MKPTRFIKKHKNNKMNTTPKVLLILLLIFTGISNAQTSDIVGDWLLEKIENDGKTQPVNQLVSFNQDGTIYIQETPFGTWQHNTTDQTLLLNMEIIKGVHQIIKNEDNKLIIKLDGDTTYFIKIDKQAILKNNEASGLIGVWEFEKNSDTDLKEFITFKTPNAFSLFQKGEGMESTSSGTWVFNTKEKTLILIGFIEKLAGTSTLISLNETAFSIKNKDKIYTLKRVIQDAIKIERLTFTSEDFYDENGDYKYYDDEQKLPWQDTYQMIASLSKVKQLVYQFSTLIDNTKSFETKTLTADVVANQAEQTLSIDYIFNGFDRYNLPDDTALQPNEYNGYAMLFPFEDNSFRIVGEEETTTAAGTFTCTVLEVAGSFDEKIKLYMIKDKPGIIAKIIKDKSGSFGHYHTFELQEIKQ